MAYQISYSANADDKRQSSSLLFMTVCIFLLFLVLVNAFWPEGSAYLRNFLIPGDANFTTAAFETFVSELRAGTPFSDSLEAFCQQVLEDAYSDIR